MGGFKAKREAEDIKRQLSGLFGKVKDPAVSKGMLSIMRVELSSDLSAAKVYVSALGGKQATQKAVCGLQKAVGFLRHELAMRVRMKKCPILTFIADDSIAYSAHVNQLLKDLQKEHKDGSDDKTGSFDAAKGKGMDHSDT